LPRAPQAFQSTIAPLQFHPQELRLHRSDRKAIATSVPYRSVTIDQKTRAQGLGERFAFQFQLEIKIANFDSASWSELDVTTVRDIDLAWMVESDGDEVARLFGVSDRK